MKSIYQSVTAFFKHVYHELFGIDTVDAAQLWGIPFVGQILTNWSSDGLGMYRIRKKAAKLAEKHPQGRCEWSIGPYRMLLITLPEDIEHFLKNYKNKLVDHGDPLTFEAMFRDKKNVFSTSVYDELWQFFRAQYRHSLDPEKHQACIQRNINLYLKRVAKEGSKIPISHLMLFLTFDIISETQFGFKNLKEKGKEELKLKLADNISKIIKILSPHWIQELAKIFPFVLRPPFSRWFLPEFTRLRDESYRFLRESLIVPNENNLDKSDTSWWAFAQKNGMSADQALENLFAQVIVPGYHTTSGLLFAANNVLAKRDKDGNPSEIFLTLQAEIDAYAQKTGQSPDEWNSACFNNLPYLNQVCLELLRLFSPVQDIMYTVKDDIPFAGGYERGSMIMISPGATHTSKLVYEDPLEFKPSRFDGKTVREMYEVLRYSFFPAGFLPRRCPGFPLASKELEEWIVNLVYGYDNFKTDHDIVPGKDTTAITFLIHYSDEARKSHLSITPRLKFDEVKDEKDDLPSHQKLKIL